MRQETKPTLKPYYEHCRSSSLLDFIHWPVMALLMMTLGLEIAFLTHEKSIIVDRQYNLPLMNFRDLPAIPKSVLGFRLQQREKRLFLNEIVAIEKKLMKKLQQDTGNFTINVLRNGSLLIKFARDYFPIGEAELTESMKTALNNFVPKLYAQLFADEKLKNAIHKVTLYGFSSPYSESEDSEGPKKYNQKLALSRARSIFNYIFNIEKMKFREQDFAVKITTISGQGTVALARMVTPARKQDLLKKFCLTNDCYQTRYIMLEPQLMNKKVSRSIP
jgi:hypothetical protein